MRRVTVGGCDLAYASAGTGPPVLMIHGLTGNRWIWHHVTPRIASSFCVVAPDLAARGGSPPSPRERYDLEAERGRLVAFVRALELHRPLVIGHSQGAALALALAARGPPLRAMVLVNPVTPWTRRPGALRLLELPGVAAVARWLVPLLRRPVTRWVLRHRVFTGRSAAPPEAVERFSAPYRSPRRARSLPAVLAGWNPAALAPYFPPPSRPPARVLAGGRDARIRPVHAQRLADRLGASLRVLEDAGHAIPLERPGAVADAVVALAGSVEASPGPPSTEATRHERGE